MSFLRIVGPGFWWSLFFGPASSRSYNIGVVGNNLLVGNAVFSETALRIFLIFCIKLGDYKGRKRTEPNFWKKLLVWRCSRKRLQISPKSDTFIFFWLVGNAVFSEMALRIFLIFCIKLGDYKGRKVIEPSFWKKSPNWTKIRRFHIFLKNGSKDFFGFRPEVSTKNLET